MAILTSATASPTPTRLLAFFQVRSRMVRYYSGPGLVWTGQFNYSAKKETGKIGRQQNWLIACRKCCWGSLARVLMTTRPSSVEPNAPMSVMAFLPNSRQMSVSSPTELCSDHGGDSAEGIKIYWVVGFGFLSPFVDSFISFILHPLVLGRVWSHGLFVEGWKYSKDLSSLL